MKELQNNEIPHIYITLKLTANGPGQHLLDMSPLP
jgi:hypothetical protein